jgi:hypothetical protein
MAESEVDFPFGVIQHENSISKSVPEFHLGRLSDSLAQTEQPMSGVNGNPNVTSEAAELDKIPPETEIKYIPANSSHLDMDNSVANGG